MNSSNYLDSGIRTVRLEKEAVAALEKKIDASFASACKLIQNTPGRIVVTGIGKSGHIANKIAATLASTGTPAFFMHAGEASHGDLGMLTENDTVIAISGSGSTQEVISLIPLIRRLGAKLISLTGNPDSPLAKQSDAHLDVSVEREACPLELAPTSSTTCTLVMGDALAVALIDARGFTAEDFAFSHPGGSLGRRLLLKVEDVMATNFPKVTEQTPLTEALLEMTDKGLGMTTVIKDGMLSGIFTDGDLRRCLDNRQDIHQTQIHKVMSRNCKTTTIETLAAKALKDMQDHKISCLVVLNEEKKVVGVVHLHALIKAGIA